MFCRDKRNVMILLGWNAIIYITVLKYCLFLGTNVLWR